MVNNEFKVILFLRLSLGFVRKILIFVKTSKFLPKRYLFIFCIFYIIKRIEQEYLKKYTKSEIFNSIFHKTKKQKKINKNI